LSKGIGIVEGVKTVKTVEALNRNDARIPPLVKPLMLALFNLLTF
jgi:hypothetical protein